MVTVEYGKFAQIFHLVTWFFEFITGITFKWDYAMWRIITLMAWISLLIKLRIYKVPPDPFRCSCQSFGFLWRPLILICMLLSKNCIKLYHRKQVKVPSNMKLATSLMNFEFHPYGIFEGFSYHQEYESINPNIFEFTVGLGDRINKLVY